MDGDADSARIRVSDIGKSIGPGFRPFIFDHFRQADPSSARRYGGLGRVLVKHLVELHGRTITVASEGEGRGEAFTVTLPMIAPSAAPPIARIYKIEIDSGAFSESKPSFSRRSGVSRLNMKGVNPSRHNYPAGGIMVFD
jgi:hypothetical protein